MRQRIRALRASENGFTLTELLIVIVILGVLTGVVVIAVGAFTDRGETAACKSDKKSVETAAEAYRAKVGHYPDATSNPGRLDQLVAPPAPATSGAGYLRETPNTDKYVITLNEDGSVTADKC
jgi:prepilin-type N-terminal cleavage/methylation domain-containing protein